MRRRPFSLVAVLLLVLSTSSCAIIGGGESHYGGTATLSDAAAEARPDTSKSARKKHRRLHVGETITPATSVTIESEGPATEPESSVEGIGPSPASGSKSDFGATPPLLSLVFGGGTIGGPGYDGFGEFGLEIGGWATPRWRFDLLGSVSPIQFSDETIASQSFKNEVDLNLDLTARYYLTASHTFMGVYPVGGVRFGTLFWDYARPVSVLEDGVTRKVESDYINHFSIYGGLGVSVIQIRHMQVSTNLLSGVRFYSWDTHAGFSNTMFPPCGFVQLRCEAGYRF